MNPAKKEMIENFLYEAILTDEFFDALYETLAEEVDLDDEDIQDLVEKSEEKYEATLVTALTNFLDYHFSDQEITDLIIHGNEEVMKKFDEKSEKFYQLIEVATQDFVEELLKELNACQEETDCCCN